MITLAEVKTYLRITDTTDDDYIEIIIPDVENYIMMKLGIDTLENEAGIKKVIAEFIRYDLKVRLNKELGVSSKTLGDSSKSYETLSEGYPIEVLGLLKPYSDKYNKKVIFI